MDKLKNIEDIKKYISENRKEAVKIDLNAKYPSYIYMIKGKYWITSRIAKLDDILQDHTFFENLTEIFKFIFDSSVTVDGFVSADDKDNFIVQRQVKENEKNNIDDLIDQYEAYVEYIVEILNKNKLDSQITSNSLKDSSQVLMP